MPRSEFLFFIKAAPCGGRWSFVPESVAESSAPDGLARRLQAGLAARVGADEATGAVRDGQGHDHRPPQGAAKGDRSIEPGPSQGISRRRNNGSHDIQAALARTVAQAVEVLAASVTSRLKLLANDRLKLEEAIRDPQGERVIGGVESAHANVVEECRVLHEILEQLRTALINS